MASIRCAHCTDTHTSVAEVRACATRVGIVAPVGVGPRGLGEAFAEARQPEGAAPTRVRGDRSGWELVTALRQQARALLVREDHGKKVGYFALLAEEDGADKVKFYRLRTGKRGGKWASHLFVDAQASDDFWPVRDASTLHVVLEGILADPEAAALLYGTELGQCNRCRRTLTDETSRKVGRGPECRKKD